MKLLIGIATYQRTQKLYRCLDSLRSSSYQDYKVVVIADNNDVATLEFMKTYWNGFSCFVQPKHEFVIGAWNKAVAMGMFPVVGMEEWDGFIGLCDDVELSKYALENAVESHKKHFPDGDGVIGFNQDCPGHEEYTFKWFGQTLMGRKFIERYKAVNYQICCPDYKHFYQDEEMYHYALSLGKFHCESTALLHHYHPSFIVEERDSTHDIIRVGDLSPRSHDMEMQVKRKHLGMLWGENFNLIGSL